ncbi:androgen-dependent TFPI-regulating protein-like, partial [Polyodon spathula]|uniref:androgen-dependent TFPI-regulating protein-like n=1 Tax=Polyodon spathula TaxID=7913 RepID=UPI001B7F6E02
IGPSSVLFPHRFAGHHPGSAGIPSGILCGPVLSFWLLYAHDRELVYPKPLDDIIPQWLNHAMHTGILPLLLVELYIIPHHFTSQRNGILGLTLLKTLLSY